MLLRSKTYANDGTLLSAHSKAILDDGVYTIGGHPVQDEALYDETTTNNYAVRAIPIREYPRKKIIGYCQAGDIIQLTGDTIIEDGTSWAECSVWWMNRTLDGWTKESDIEKYHPLRNINLAPIPSGMKNYSKTNIAQYIDMYKITGRRVTYKNLCGYFCLARLLGLDIYDLLRDFQATKEGFIKLSKDNTTSLYDLNLVARMYNKYITKISFGSTYIFKVSRFIKGIAPCGVDSSGKIVPNGRIRHWVVWEGIVPYGTSGFFKIYNPMTNNIETIPIQLFMDSNPLGLQIGVLND